MAEALWRLRDGRARLITAVGDDADGVYLQDIASGLILDGCVVPNARTASYAAVLDASGECKLGLGDMTVHNHITPELVNKYKVILEQAALVVLDGNVPQPTLDYVLQLCNTMDKPVFFEPTDRRKAIKSLYSKQRLSFSSPNLSELRAMATYLKPDLQSKGNDIQDIMYLGEIVAQIVDYLIITLGSKGVLIVRQKVGHSSLAKFYRIKALKTVKNVSGAGDCFASGFIHGFLSGWEESDCISSGFSMAKLALLNEKTVPSDVNKINSSVLATVDYEEIYNT